MNRDRLLIDVNSNTSQLRKAIPVKVRQAQPMPVLRLSKPKLTALAKKLHNFQMDGYSLGQCIGLVTRVHEEQIADNLAMITDLFELERMFGD